MATSGFRTRHVDSTLMPDSDPTFKVHVSDASTAEGELLLLTIVGELDFSAAPQAQQAVLDGISEGYKAIVIDLKDCRFIDSTGLGMLVNLHRQRHTTGASIVLARLSDKVLRILQVTLLDRVLPIATSLDEARSLIRQMNDASKKA